MAWNDGLWLPDPALPVRGRLTRSLAELLARQARAAHGPRGAATVVEQVGTLIEHDRVISRRVVRRAQPGSLWVATTLPDGTHGLRYDAGGAWVQAPGQPQAVALAGEAARALWRAAQWPGPALTLAGFQAHGHSVALLGLADQAGSADYVLRLRLSDGTTRDYALDARTHLLRRARDVVAAGPSGAGAAGGEPAEWRWEDYRSVDGCRLAFGEEERRLSDGRVLRTWQWRSVRLNPPPAA